MSVLSALVRAYERLPDPPPFGFSMEKIGFVVSLRPDGAVAHVVDLRDAVGKKRVARTMLVPQPVKRTVAVSPNLLWDKTAYALGVTAGEGKRTAQEHAAFVERHERLLAGVEDEGFAALLAFLSGWSPERFDALGWPAEMKDQNVVFALESERLAGVYLHDRPAARSLIAREGGEGTGRAAICLVTGERGPVARLHPSIKGVWGAQTAGAALVSFNLDAFASYGHEQGDNAPVSAYAAFAYATALNRFLDRDSGRRLQLGDASVVFWADSEDAVARAMAEEMFRQMIDPAQLSGDDKATLADELTQERVKEDRAATAEIRDKLLRMARGEALDQIEPRLAAGVRFHVLGLAPNAARLAVRFFYEDDFGALAKHYRDWLGDTTLEPLPADRPLPAFRRLALRTAPAMKDRNGVATFDAKAASPLLVGELLRAALTGAAFPVSLLSLLLMRVRGDHHLDASRMALIKAIIVRRLRLAGKLPPRPDGTPDKEYLMRSDPEDANDARRLGRLFAVIERAQRAALGENLSATVADKFLAAASATPGRLFPSLILAARTHHVKRLRNGHSDADWIASSEEARKMASILDRDIGRLVAPFGERGFPDQHSAEEQGLFLIGYYQERWGKSPKAAPDAEIAITETDNEESAS